MGTTLGLYPARIILSMENVHRYDTGTFDVYQYFHHVYTGIYPLSYPGHLVPGVHIVCVEQPKSRASNVFRDVHIMRIVRHQIHNT